jgi:hypothetical protein
MDISYFHQHLIIIDKLARGSYPIGYVCSLMARLSILNRHYLGEF